MLKNYESGFSLENINLAGKSLRCRAYFYNQSKTLRMYLRPYQNPEIKICVPSVSFSIFRGTSKKSINNFITQRLCWIEKHVEQWPDPKYPLQQGNITCFGQLYIVKIIDNNLNAKKTQIKCFLNKSRNYLEFNGLQQQLGPEIKNWLKQQLLIKAQNLLPYYLAQISWNKEKPKLKLSHAYRNWGCCHTKTNKISLNWRLSLAPVNVMEYVLAHEVSHLIHPNHGINFWKLTNKIFPNTSEIKYWLKNNINEIYSWNFD